MTCVVCGLLASGLDLVYELLPDGTEKTLSACSTCANSLMAANVNV